MAASAKLKVTESESEVIHDPKAQTVPTTSEQYLVQFRNNFELNILERPSPNELVFELVHVDTSFANALRRILLSEIPTVAIEHVYISKNSSIIHDEVFAHRLGLVPLNTDARLMDDYVDATPENHLNNNVEGEEDAEEVGATDRNTLVFRLSVSCTHAEAREAANKSKRPIKQQQLDEDEDMDRLVADGEADLAQVAQEVASKQAFQFPKDRPYTKNVYSRHIEWIPQGDQEENFSGEKAIRPIYGDILLAKLRPGQSIELEAHARKGVGKDHAKFSPVSTASYRLLPHIEIVHDVYDELAEELVHVYEPGVFELVPTSPDCDPPGTRQKVKVKNPYACTMSRNFMRNDVLAKSINITRITDHFIFSIESVGMHPPAILLAEALRVLQRKCQRLMDLADTAAGHDE